MDADSLVTLQNQINSLAAVTLQTRRALNLLTSEKGGTCIFLGGGMLLFCKPIRNSQD